MKQAPAPHPASVAAPPQGRPPAISAIPLRAGIGLRHSHVREVLATPAVAAWVEVHSENYLAQGGPRQRALEAIRRDLPLSCHGVGLSLGSVDGLDRDHLARLKALFDRFQPALVSEHVSWSMHGGVYLNDLLPLPYTDEALEVVCRNVDQAQMAFGRRILVENPSSYVRFGISTMPESAFMAEVARRTGCGILLDVNNIHVSARNHRFDAADYLAAIPATAVEEIHLAGHCVRQIDGETLLIDDHGDRIADPVWTLYRQALDRIGPRPILIEWDTKLPPLAVLLAEADKAERLLDAARSTGGQADAA